MSIVVEFWKIQYILKPSKIYFEFICKVKLKSWPTLLDVWGNTENPLSHRKINKNKTYECLFLKYFI